MNAYKTVAPKRFSFAAAVARYGDDWRYGIPLIDVGMQDLKTLDYQDALLMCLMERGTHARVYESPFEENLYPRMEVGEYGFGYCAHREDYDLGRPVGVGYTRYQAISHFLDAEELHRG